MCKRSALHDRYTACVRRLSALLVILIGLMTIHCSPGPDGLDTPSVEQIRAETRVQFERRLASGLERAAARTDSIDELFRPIAFLTPAEENSLRRYLNRDHLARARALGIPPGVSVESREAMLADGRLVELEAETEYWIVRRLDYSSPLVVPAVRVMLTELGERFQGQLAEIGVPPFRFEISSVLRTAEDQIALRRRNPNAARGVSTHEYATTVDVAYNGFAAPAARPGRGARPEPEVGSMSDAALADDDDERDRIGPYLDTIEELMLERIAGRRSGEMKAILGHVLREMQAEGLVLVTLERQQPVYHLTVGR